MRQLAHADQLARAVGLDMATYWQPDEAAYFGRVSKTVILGVVRHAVSPEAADNIASLKKAAMAEAAAKRLAGKDWLPAADSEALRTGFPRRPDSVPDDCGQPLMAG